jgi:hypothetical protein
VVKRNVLAASIEPPTQGPSPIYDRSRSRATPKCELDNFYTEIKKWVPREESSSFSSYDGLGSMALFPFTINLKV